MKMMICLPTMNDDYNWHVEQEHPENIDDCDVLEEDWCAEPVPQEDWAAEDDWCAEPVPQLNQEDWEIVEEDWTVEQEPQWNWNQDEWGPVEEDWHVEHEPQLNPDDWHADHEPQLNHDDWEAVEMPQEDWQLDEEPQWGQDEWEALDELQEDQAVWDGNDGAFDDWQAQDDWGEGVWVAHNQLPIEIVEDEPENDDGDLFDALRVMMNEGRIPSHILPFLLSNQFYHSKDLDLNLQRIIDDGNDFLSSDDGRQFIQLFKTYMMSHSCPTDDQIKLLSHISKTYY